MQTPWNGKYARVNRPHATCMIKIALCLYGLLEELKCTSHYIYTYLPCRGFIKIELTVMCLGVICFSCSIISRWTWICLKANRMHAKLFTLLWNKSFRSEAVQLWRQPHTHTHHWAVRLLKGSAFQHKTDRSGVQAESVVWSPRLSCMLTHEADPGCAVCTNLLWTSLRQITATELLHTLPPVPWQLASTLTAASAGVSCPDFFSFCSCSLTLCSLHLTDWF